MLYVLLKILSLNLQILQHYCYKHSKYSDMMYSSDCIIRVYFVLVIKFIPRSICIINRNLQV